MKAIGTLLIALAPLGSALVIPNADVVTSLASDADKTDVTWLDSLYNHCAQNDDLSTILSPVASDAADENAFHRWIEKATSFADSLLDSTVERVAEHPHHPPHHDHDHPHTDEFTIWQLLEKTDHGKKFTELASGFKSIVNLLNSTNHNYTLFIPADRAFERIPEHHHKPTDDELEEFLQYHIVHGEYDAARIWHRNTLPTVLDEKFLGGEAQRVRVRIGLKGVTLNGYSNVIMPNIHAKNGVIHAIDHVLLPPVMIGKGLSLFPSVFSTLLHAYEKTDFVKYIHSVPMEGSTVFAPSNRAFARLGIRTNAFLFETERGRKILTAILKYQIVANTTLYSDAAYGKLSAQSQDDATIQMGRSTHYELKSLYDDKSLGVDIWRWGGWTRIKVNGFASVAYADGIAKNGVVHIVDTVPMPPCPRNGNHNVVEGEITIEDLEERFSDFVEHDNKLDAAPGSQIVISDL